MGNIFLEITIILSLAAFLTIIFRFFKQPPILAYILTGIIIGPFGQLQLGSKDLLGVLGQFGITLLLFMLGLEMKLKELKTVGKTAFIIGISQIALTSASGFFIASRFGFLQVSSFYIALALTFSSTVIVVKILSDKKDLNSLYGKILIGLLLIQDFFAVLALVLLSGLNVNSTQISFELLNFENLFFVALKGLIIFLSVIILSKLILPMVVNKIAKSPETLFLFSIAWVFGVAAIVSSKTIGFSIEIGGFLAGIALANASENFQIIARMKALRDFFVTIFFVFLGMRMVFDNIGAIILPILILSAFVILIKPLIVMSVMGMLSYRKRTSFLTAVSIGQVSEFSLIIIFLGNKLGHISNEIVSLITAVGIISFIVSAYLTNHANTLFKFFANYLFFFERKHTQKENIGPQQLEDLKDHVVLIGARRMGDSILGALCDLGYKIVVVDFDPDVINSLRNKGVKTFFGDIADLDIQERVMLNKAKLVISTVSDPEDNLSLIKSLNRNNKKAKIIVMAGDGEDTKEFYKAGADYVVLPHLSGGRHVAKILKEDKLDEMASFKSKDLLELA